MRRGLFRSTLRTLRVTAPIRACLAGRFDERRVLALTSSPRSGSTLLAQLLKSIPRTCVLFEPLQREHVSEAAELFSGRTYVDPGAEWPEGKEFLRRVFEGRVVNNWTSQEMTFREACRATRMIVKFVRANRLLPWMCRNFELPSPVLLIRHPCAAISSQMNYGWAKSSRPQAPSFLDEFPRFQAALERTNSDEEHLAAMWALDQLPPLLQPPPHPYILVTYENLVRHPESTLARILDRWKLDADMEAAIANLRRPSSVVNKAGISGLDGWKKQLSADQIDRIMNTVRRFGLTFYDEGDELDETELVDARFAGRLRAAGSG